MNYIYTTRKSALLSRMSNRVFQPDLKVNEYMGKGGGVNEVMVLMQNLYEHSCLTLLSYFLAV